MTFLGGGGRGAEVWAICEKDIQQTAYDGKKFNKEIPEKKIPTMTQISFMAYNPGKNLTPLYVRGYKFYHQRFGKKFLPEPNHANTPSKVKWSVPNMERNIMQEKKYHFHQSERECDTFAIQF